MKLLPIAMALLVLGATVVAQDMVRHENPTRKMAVQAPPSWIVRADEHSLTVFAPTQSTEVYTPTVSMNIESISGARKRLEPYVESFQSNIWLMAENISGWKRRDTTWNGLPAAVVDFSSSYAGSTLVTRVVMAVEGDHAYVCRAMWLDDATPQQIDTALTVLRSAKRIPSAK